MELISSLNENTNFGEVTDLEKEMMYMVLKKDKCEVTFRQSQ